VLLEYTIKNELSDVDKYMEVDIFKSDRLERYIKADLPGYREKVMYVNMDRDKNYFEDPNIIEKYSVTMLVNKHNKLVENYSPELVRLDKCSTGEEYLTKEAKEAYDSLCDASLKAGMKLGVTSSYRSYQSQTEVYNYYLKNNGKSYVEKYVATPGYSEHQTALALDVKSLSGSTFKYTKEYKWMLENSYKYGFILRFPEGKEDLTGYGSESWHYRYVGVDIATYIHDKNITFEEYYVQFLDK
jgi:LAS superfamily LD-carboxypeptidase LdcB